MMEDKTIFRDSITDYIDAQAKDYYKHKTENICQRCGEKGVWRDISLDCRPDDSEENMFESPIFDMVTLCEKCHKELKVWLNIPTHDTM